MSIRNLDENHDWTFGSGRSNYLNYNAEIGLNIETRLLSFLGDCFFDTDAGIDWFNLLEYNRSAQLQSSVEKTIAQTDGVVKVNNVDILTNADRTLTLQYSVTTIYSTNYQGQVEFNYGR